MQPGANITGSVFWITLEAIQKIKHLTHPSPPLRAIDFPKLARAADRHMVKVLTVTLQQIEGLVQVPDGDKFFSGDL